jgi:hypothetical protein
MWYLALLISKDYLCMVEHYLAIRNAELDETKLKSKREVDQMVLRNSEGRPSMDYDTGRPYQRLESVDA